jgi:hypothetical protein
VGVSSTGHRIDSPLSIANKVISTEPGAVADRLLELSTALEFHDGIEKMDRELKPPIGR